MPPRAKPAEGCAAGSHMPRKSARSGSGAAPASFLPSSEDDIESESDSSPTAGVSAGAANGRRVQSPLSLSLSSSAEADEDITTEVLVAQLVLAWG
eukprot:COSAG06_NODE_13766_length_1221_cov_7.631818_1_plen_95_part_10